MSIVRRAIGKARRMRMTPVELARHRGATVAEERAWARARGRRLL